MAEVDVSSYKTTDAPNPLDIANKLGTMQLQKGAIERQGVGIEQDKLKLYNERHQIFNREMANLVADPDVNGGTPNAIDKVRQAGQRMVNLGLIPAPMYAEYVKAIPTDPKQIPQYVQQMVTRAKTINDAVNYNYGEVGSVENGQTIQPTVSSNKPGFGVRSIGQPIQKQVPVTQPVIGENNKLTLQGPQPPQLPEGGSAVAAPPPMDLSPRLSVDTRTPNVVGQQPMVGKDESRVRPRLPTGPAVGMTPLFEEGKKKFAEMSGQAGDLLFRNKSAEQALPLIKDLTTGVGTETVNKALAGLHNIGFLSANMTDKVAQYQELNKKLAQFVKDNGTRSDAEQALNEAGSPNAKQQITPALEKLVKDTIILNRVRAAIPIAFEGEKFDEFHRHAATFAQRIDERAFGLDHMEPKERLALMMNMDKKLKSDKASEVAEAKKFKRSLEIVERLGIF